MQPSQPADIKTKAQGDESIRKGLTYKRRHDASNRSPLAQKRGNKRTRRTKHNPLYTVQASGGLHLQRLAQAALLAQELADRIQSQINRLVQQEDMPSCSARGHVFLFGKSTCFLVEQEDLSS